jgi:hypothetical protein
VCVELEMRGKEMTRSRREGGEAGEAGEEGRGKPGARRRGRRAERARSWMRLGMKRTEGGDEIPHAKEPGTASLQQGFPSIREPSLPDQTEEKAGTPNEHARHLP